MIAVGIDIGSLSTKSAVMNNSGVILGYDVLLTGGNNRNSAEKTYKNVLEKAGLDEQEISTVVTTGYGRENVPFSHKQITEITCHARGMHFLFPDVRTILDIGGQDSKAIQIDEDCNVADFLMNDKCAAGCGRFLEIIARALGINLEDMGDISLEAKSAAKISNMCTVFAETEVVSLVAVGTPIPDIVKGVHESIADRAVSLIRAVGLKKPLGMSGGVAYNKGVVAFLEEKLDLKVVLSDYSQIVGAIGAACVGLNGG